MNTIRGFLIAVILIAGLATAYFGSQYIDFATYSTAFICGMALLSLSITYLRKEDDNF